MYKRQGKPLISFVFLFTFFGRIGSIPTNGDTKCKAGKRPTLVCEICHAKSAPSTYSRTERELITARRGNAHKLGLALHIGFLRLSGRLLNSVRIVPAMLWQHLGNEIGIATPELPSLRALYGRGRTLFDHQQLACEVLGFQWMTEGSVALTGIPKNCPLQVASVVKNLTTYGVSKTPKTAKGIRNYKSTILG